MGPYRKLQQGGLVFLTLLVLTACSGSTPPTAVPSAPMSTATPAPTQASDAVAPTGTTTTSTAVPAPTRTPALSTDPTAVTETPVATEELVTPAPTVEVASTTGPDPAATPRPVPTSIPIQGYEGTGQQVSAQFELFEGVSLFTMTHDGSGHFAVQLLDEGGQLVDLLANETGGFEGSKAVGIKEGGRRAQPGTHILNISADGNWTVSIEQ